MRLADFNSASTNGSSTSSNSSSKTTNSPAPRPSQSNGLKAGPIAGIAVGGCAALLIITISLGYLFKRRRTLQNSKMGVPKSSNEHNELSSLNIKQDGLMEMDGARVGELQEQGIQELEHPMPAVELQAYQHHHRDEAWS